METRQWTRGLTELKAILGAARQASLLPLQRGLTFRGVPGLDEAVRGGSEIVLDEIPETVLLAEPIFDLQPGFYPVLDLIDRRPSTAATASFGFTLGATVGKAAGGVETQAGVAGVWKARPVTLITYSHRPSLPREALADVGVLLVDAEAAEFVRAYLAQVEVDVIMTVLDAAAVEVETEDEQIEELTLDGDSWSASYVEQIFQALGQQARRRACWVGNAITRAALACIGTGTGAVWSEALSLAARGLIFERPFVCDESLLDNELVLADWYHLVGVAEREPAGLRGVRRSGGDTVLEFSARAGVCIKDARYGKIGKLNTGT